MPAIAYAAQPFFRSAVAALKARRLNMDVPISLGIMLATAMSLFQTMRGTEQVYFDAAITLTFFLLIGRYLDEKVRVRARGAAENLLGLKALAADRHRRRRHGAPPARARARARHARAGRRPESASPSTAACSTARRDIDDSLITGETRAAPDGAGEIVHAGTVNLTRAITVEATATDDNTLLAEIARLMQAAEQGRGHYVRLADRAARLYAPAVHVLGAATFLGWMLAGAGWEQALTYAIAVLIITCPCALALAVPAVQVAATSRLFAKGVIVKAADGLERLSEVDTIVFDKTGTLTRGEPSLAERRRRSTMRRWRRAASLAVASRHPYSKAVVRAARERGLASLRRQASSSIPGCGLLATRSARRAASRVGGVGRGRRGAASRAGLALVSPTGQAAPVGFRFDDALRSDARSSRCRAARAPATASSSCRATASVRSGAAARAAGIARLGGRGAPRRQDRAARGS